MLTLIGRWAIILEPILVEAAWITGALVLLLVAAERRGRTPGAARPGREQAALTRRLT